MAPEGYRMDLRSSIQMPEDGLYLVSPAKQEAEQQRVSQMDVKG